MWEIVYDRRINEWKEDAEWIECSIGPLDADLRDDVIRVLAGDWNVGNITVQKYKE